jgi:hypothetical protein
MMPIFIVAWQWWLGCVAELACACALPRRRKMR